MFSSKEIPYTLIRFDLPGHGQAYRSESAEDYAFAQIRSAILQALSSVDGDILLVGTSIGGNLCLQIAPDLEQLQGVLIYGTAPLKKPLNLQEAFNTFPLMGFRFLADVPEQTVFDMFKRITYNHEILPDIVADFLQADPHVRSALWNDFASGKELPDEVRIFKDLEVPRYVMLGDMDLVPNTSYIKSLQSGSHPFELIEVDNCGHFPTLDQPAVFIRHLNRIAGEVFE